MTAERLVRLFAGSFVLLSLALGVEASPLFASRHFLWFTAFVGANLLQDNGFQLRKGRRTTIEMVLGAQFGQAT